MDLYRLKKEAVPFFEYKFKNRAEKMDFWRDNHISSEALEQAPKAYIKLGIKTSDISTTISGWEGPKSLTDIAFTLMINDTSNAYYHKFTQDGNVRELLEELEKTANEFIKNYKP